LVSKLDTTASQYIFNLILRLFVRLRENDMPLSRKIKAAKSPALAQFPFNQMNYTSALL
jgi:hypothetical protein